MEFDLMGGGGGWLAMVNLLFQVPKLRSKKGVCDWSSEYG